MGNIINLYKFTGIYTVKTANKSLKLVRVAHWTPSTGAASQYRAGFSRRLAPR